MNQTFWLASCTAAEQNVQRMIEPQGFKPKGQRWRRQILSVVIIEKTQHFMGSQSRELGSDIISFFADLEPPTTVKVAIHTKKDLWLNLAKSIDRATDPKIWTRG